MAPAAHLLLTAPESEAAPALSDDAKGVGSSGEAVHHAYDGSDATSMEHDAERSAQPPDEAAIQQRRENARQLEDGSGVSSLLLLHRGSLLLSSRVHFWNGLHVELLLPMHAAALLLRSGTQSEEQSNEQVTDPAAKVPMPATCTVYMYGRCSGACIDFIPLS